MNDKDDIETLDTSLSLVDVNKSIVEDGFRSACSSGDLDILRSILSACTEEERHELLHQESVSGPPIIDAIITGRYPVVSYLLEQGYDLELEFEINLFYPVLFRDKLCTALCVSCALGRLKTTQLLLEKGADVNHTSQNSSPLIYASEYNNPELISLLLQWGADVNKLPQGVQTATAAMPLHRACLEGNKDSADILFNSTSVSLEKRISLLGLLGAQCINRNQDYESGIKYWKMALQDLSVMPSGCRSESEDLSVRLQKLYIEEAVGQPNVSQICLSEASTSHMTGPRVEHYKHRHCLFKDMKLCTTTEELDAISQHHHLLNLQGLLVLEHLFGPNHAETTQQVSRAAREALENQDLAFACKLFLYIIESTEKQDDSQSASEYSSQLADLLLNVFTNSPQNLASIGDFTEILLAAMEFTQQGFCKVHASYLQCQSGDQNVNSQIKQHPRLKLLAELSETFLAFFRMLIDQPMRPDQWPAVYHMLHQITHALSQCKEGALSKIPTILLRILTFGGQTASSTLYFFQEELFPNVQILECFLKCGLDINRQDPEGNTSLCYSLDCPRPDLDIVSTLLEYGGHVDVCNNYGVTPYSLMQHKACSSLHPFQYLSLKCLAATAIMSFCVPYVGQIPVVLEQFVPLHGIRRQNNAAETGLKRSASEGDLHVKTHEREGI